MGLTQKFLLLFTMSLIVGKLIINEFGNGFINYNNKVIYICKNDLSNAFDGETVTVKYYQNENQLNVGKVINYSLVDKIFIGTVHHHYIKSTFIFCDELTKSNLIELETDSYLEKNRWVQIKIISHQNNKIKGTLLQILPTDIDNIIQNKFKLNILDINVNIDTNKLTSNHLDQTELNTFTIDPMTSQDCDDGFSIKHVSNFIYKIYVHISDVAHWFNPDTCNLDEIILRGNTFYGLSTNWPMIPPTYANNICSILPNKITYVVTNEFEYNQTEKKLVFIKWFYSKVQSKNKYDYEFMDQNMELNEFKILKETHEIIKKNIKDIDISNDSLSHNIIKYWMIHVNQIMCQEIQKIYRVNPEPDPSKFTTLELYLNQSIDRHLLSTKSTDKLVRYLTKELLTKAYYTKTNSLHYGLGINYYTHWTSPIRRSCDLINHLILKGYNLDKNLDQWLEYANDAELLQNKIEKFIINKNIKFNYDYLGIIIKLGTFGITVYIEELDDKSTIHISKLSKNRLNYTNNKLFNDINEYFIFDKIIVNFSEKDISVKIENITI